jgi:transcriptional regulator with XRE-family HTH domain
MGDDDDAEGAVPFEAERRFATNLRTTRERKGMTQAQLAEAMTEHGIPGWRQQTVTRVENGHRRIWIGEAQALADILGTTMERLTWAQGEDRALTDVDDAIVVIKRAWQQVSDAVVSLDAARASGRYQLAEAQASKYERVREAAAELEEWIAARTLESAVDDGLGRRGQFGLPSEPALAEGGIIANGLWGAISDEDQALMSAAAFRLQEQGVPGPYVVQRHEGAFIVLPVATVLAGIQEEAAAQSWQWGGAITYAAEQSGDEHVEPDEAEVVVPHAGQRLQAVLLPGPGDQAPARR